MTRATALLLSPALVLVLALTACGDVSGPGVAPAQTTSSPPAVGPTRPAGTPSQTETATIDGILAYGPNADQVIDLTVPDGEGSFPVVVLIHGGFWREQYGRDLMEPLARDLVSRGVAAANIEYGRVGGTGGWPGTLEDVAAALDHVVAIADPRLDLDRVAVVGHSAGGHLATWAAARATLPTGSVGAAPALRPCAVVSQAGVNDLTVAAETGRQGLGDGAVQALLGGGPDAVADRYAVADPGRLLPLASAWLGVHGHVDDTVPVSQTEDFAAALSAAGGDAEAVLVEGDHFTVIDPTSEAWTRATAWLAERCRW